MNATSANLADLFNHTLGFFRGAECRPVNHYLFFLLNRSLFGNNPAAFRILWLVMHSISAFLIYLIFHKITKNKTIALLTVFIFLTRAGLIRNFYALHYSPPKLGFFLLFTFYFYLKAQGNKILYWPLSILTYLLALGTRETFIVLPIVILAYEIIFNSDCRINATKIKSLLPKIAPYIVIVISYLLVRLPFFLQKTSVPATGRNAELKISFKTMAIQRIPLNLLNYIRFNFNALVFPIRELNFGQSQYGLPDLMLYLIVVIAFHAIYSLAFTKRWPQVFAATKKPLLFGIIWFLLFIGLYCTFENVSIDYIYTAVIGICLAAASCIEYYYCAILTKNKKIVPGIAVVILLQTFFAFYLFVRDRLKDDTYLLGWKIAGDYIKSASQSYPSIAPPSRIHLYGEDIRRSLTWEGFLFKYLYNNPDLKVIYHIQPIKMSDINREDVVFCLENQQLIDHTYIFRNKKPLL
ncbi:MAG: glycosyltransferase family 39 protein [Candidatus Schekmanbacteria bacterium]|nr:glycosyltransferase family 39 protein [Candidatus Schekmanbacteria bacterium]